tara:strand:+ start:216 stop:491 length:276 start_codon:yes stop_codon:yes gene_type:complete
MQSAQDVIPAEQINTWAHTAYVLRVHKPVPRAIAVATLVALGAYAAGLPKRCFDEDGNMRVFKGTSRSPEATYYHFLAVPVTAFAFSALFI